VAHGQIPFAVTHTIPDAMGVIIQTQFGSIVHTGDLKLDHVNGIPTDEEENEFARAFGKEKVLLLMADSTNVENPGFSIPEKTVHKNIEEIIKTIPDNSIDAVYTAWVIHNFPPQKRETIFSEIARVLKTNGVFVALEKVGNIGEQRTKDLSQAIVDLYPFVTKYNRPDLFIEWVKHDLRDEEADLIFTDDENEKLLSQNGFEWKYVKHILLEKVVVAIKK
jgi:SAM-dependent methyltransferase